MKKGVIYQYHTEIENWKERGSILIMFHKVEISTFYQIHQADLDTIFQEIKLLQQEYVEFDTEGKMIMEGDSGKFKPGKTREQFEEAWIKLMEQEPAPFKVSHEVPMQVLKNETHDET